MKMEVSFESVLSGQQLDPPCLYFKTSGGGSFCVKSFVHGILEIGVEHTKTVEQTADYVARLLTQAPSLKHLHAVDVHFGNFGNVCDVVVRVPLCKNVPGWTEMPTVNADAIIAAYKKQLKKNCGELYEIVR